MGKWIFEPLRGGPRRTPQEAELFKDKEADEGEYPGNDYLVREVIQNSLDARSEANGGPVRVRIALHDAADAPPPDRLAYYFARLQAPLEKFDVAFSDDGVPLVPARFLVCEDFGTRGLEGNTERYTDPPADEPGKQDFYWFWRNIGNSAKTGDDLGRWGLGKTVYRAVSQVRCMLGLTVRESDRYTLLMGQGVMRTHTYENEEHHPEGYWCADESGSRADPIIDWGELERFRSEWRLTRFDQAGLSVVSPFVPEELRSDRILRAVVVNFFVRILRGELVVEVCGPEVGQVLLDANSIERVCADLEWKGGKRKKLHAPPPLEFVRTCLATPPGIETNVLGPNAPIFDEQTFAADALAALRRELLAGELVSVRVRVLLPRKTGEPQVGSMDVFLQRSEDGRRYDSYYVREGMTISKRSAPRAESQGIQSFVNVDKGPLAKLLGDTEGPAHEDWDKSADRPDREWKSWKSRVEFARKIVDRLAELLTPPQTEPDFDALAEFFSVDRPAGEQREKSRGEKEPGNGKFPSVMAVPKWFRISERPGGVMVARNAQVPLPADPALKIAVAYDLPRGNPLKNWQPIDFVISTKEPGGVRPTGKNVNATLLKGNEVRLELKDRSEDSFSFRLDGFDPFIDLYVRVDDVSGEPDTVSEDES